MKKLLLFMLLLGLPAYANVEFDSDNYGLVSYPESSILSVETTMYPSYGVKVKFTNGETKFFMACTKNYAPIMLEMAYVQLGKYHHWQDQYTYSLIKKQDKARLGNW